MTTMKHRHEDEYRSFAPLFHELADHSAPESRRRQVRERLVTGHLPLADHIARRFHRRGQPEEDLRQVATIGLINAVDRFDPERGTDFVAFAVPTITGEIRRYFRDLTWAMRVPRRLKELYAHVNAKAEKLAQELGRASRPSELAATLGLSVDEVYEALQVGLVYRSESLDDGDGGTYGGVGAVDHDLAAVEDRETLYPALAGLPEREASIIMMRFFGNMTQSQIAERVGLSQMHVSRLLSTSLARPRDSFDDG